MRTIDTRGQQCPAPLIETRRALKETRTGESFKVLTDNRNSLNNITRFLKDNMTEFTVDESNGVWTLTIIKKTAEMIQQNTDEYCTVEIPHLTKSDFIVAFTSDKMGRGDDELGNLLMINFIKAVKDLEVLPSRMVFYNSGVKLGSSDSPLFEHLQIIERMGVELLFCATCVNYYSLEDKIKIGTLSNMYEIVQTMASASNIVKP